MTYEYIMQYAKKIGIAFTRGDIEDILERASEDNVTDLRLAVWDYLDEYEGISHTADRDLFPDGDDA
jgi:hypothetical protein